MCWSGWSLQQTSWVAQWESALHVMGLSRVRFLTGLFFSLTKCSFLLYGQIIHLLVSCWVTVWYIYTRAPLTENHLSIHESAIGSSWKNPRVTSTSRCFIVTRICSIWVWLSWSLHSSGVWDHQSSIEVSLAEVKLDVMSSRRDARKGINGFSQRAFTISGSSA